MKTEIKQQTYIAQLAQGSEEAFEQIYNRYKKLVAQVCYQMTGNIEDSKDLTQKVFLELYRKSAKLIDHPCLRGWLYMTAKNVCRDHLKYLSRKQNKEAGLEDFQNSPGSMAEYKIIQQIEDEIELLSIEDRNLIIQHYYEGFSQKEMAEKLNLNPSTLRTRLQKARESLEKNLKTKGVSAVALFFTALETRAESQPDISLPGAGEIFKAINKSGGLFMKTLMAVAACITAVFLNNYSGAKEPASGTGKSGVVAVKPSTPIELKRLTKSHNQFGFNLLKEIHEEGKNVSDWPNHNRITGKWE